MDTSEGCFRSRLDSWVWVFVAFNLVLQGLNSSRFAAGHFMWIVHSYCSTSLVPMQVGMVSSTLAVWNAAGISPCLLPYTLQTPGFFTRVWKFRWQIPRLNGGLDLGKQSKRRGEIPAADHQGTEQPGVKGGWPCSRRKFSEKWWFLTLKLEVSPQKYGFARFARRKPPYKKSPD